MECIQTNFSRKSAQDSTSTHCHTKIVLCMLLSSSNATTHNKYPTETKNQTNKRSRNLPTHKSQCLLTLNLCPLACQLNKNGNIIILLLTREEIVIFFGYNTSQTQTCWWWANVCFIKTMRILCSMAYFLAFATRSCCSDDSFGSAPPKMPKSADRDPGPNSTSPSCRKSFNGALMNGIFGCQSTDDEKQ